METSNNLGHAFKGDVLERTSSTPDGYRHNNEAGAIYPRALVFVLLLQLIFNRCSPTTVQRNVPVETLGPPSNSYNSPFTLEIPPRTQLMENTNSGSYPIGTTTQTCTVPFSRLIIDKTSGTPRFLGQTTGANMGNCGITKDDGPQMVFIPLTPDQVSSIQ